jgi:hypothetical protein
MLDTRNYEDAYNDPGSPMTRRTLQGSYLLARMDGGEKLLMSGAGAGPEGNRPFLDLLDLDTMSSERLWQSSPPFLESTMGFLIDDAEVRLVNTGVCVWGEIDLIWFEIDLIWFTNEGLLWKSNNAIRKLEKWITVGSLLWDKRWDMGVWQPGTLEGVEAVRKGEGGVEKPLARTTLVHVKGLATGR